MIPSSELMTGCGVIKRESSNIGGHCSIEKPPSMSLGESSTYDILLFSSSQFANRTPVSPRSDKYVMLKL